jgi:hypothetical protein
MVLLDKDNKTIFLKKQCKRLNKDLWLVNVVGDNYVIVKQLRKEGKLIYVRLYDPKEKEKELHERAKNKGAN